MSILNDIPRDGIAIGGVKVGQLNNPGRSLSFGRHQPTISEPQGVISVRCFKEGFDTRIVNQTSNLPGARGANSHNIYWLPWWNGRATHASWGQLATSTRFLTSTFSGCRFVVNPTGVAHVAWSGEPWYGTCGTRHHRDNAEISAGSGHPLAGNLRRTLSITGSITGRPTERRITYNADTQRCVVIGWKIGSIWTFKTITMPLDTTYDYTNQASNEAPTGKPKWATLARVDLAGGNVQFL